MKSFLVAALSAASIVSAQNAQIATNCPMGGSSLCYSVHVPEAAASSGRGDLYFQIRAPTSYSWAALGQGTMMAGAHIFVIYANSAGTNVTLSPRLAQGHFEPTYDPDTRAELVAGSGINGTEMVANVLCTNCASWGGGGRMQFNDASSNWIWAYKSGASLSTNSAAASIEQHDDHGTMTFDLTRAAGGDDDENPFLQAGASTTTSTTSGSSSSAGGGAMSGAMVLTAHAVCMALAMVVLFPSGAMIRRLLPRTTIWLHAGVQTVALMLTVAGVGLGIAVARSRDLLMRAHPIIGLVVFCLLFLQPVTGLLQHSHFKSHANRGAFGWAHKALGFGVILLGIINGGLGLRLAGNTRGGTIAYGVVAGVVGLVWFAVTAFGGWRNRRGGGAPPAASKEQSHSPQHSAAGIEQ